MYADKESMFLSIRRRRNLNNGYKEEREEMIALKMVKRNADIILGKAPRSQKIMCTNLLYNLNRTTKFMVSSAKKTAADRRLWIEDATRPLSES